MNLKVSAIKKIDVQTRINKLADGGQFPHKANRAHDYLRALMEWGLKKGLWSGENPCIGIDRFKVQSRERFMNRDELVKFFQALQKICKTEIQITIRDNILLTLMTGARQTKWFEMKWQEIDFDLELWRIPKTKHGNSHTIPLPQFALQPLDARFQRRQSECVFRGKKPNSHLAGPKSTWTAVLNEAKLKDLRIQNLRRTRRSYMAIGNQSLQIIGKALGHKSMTSTQVYAHLAHDPVQQGMEKAQLEIFSAAGLIIAVPSVDKTNDKPS
jgi:integrase